MSRQRQNPIAFILFIAAVFWWTPAAADVVPSETAGYHDETEHHGDEGRHFKNGIALFLGVTNESGHGTEPTWGLEYARKLSEKWSVGGLIDYAGGDQRNAVIAPAVFWKPFGGGFTLLAAPGLEYHNGRGEVDPHHIKASSTAVDEDEKYFVVRLGVAYWFHVGSRYGIGPTVNVDFVNNHEVWVYGVNFEVMF